MVSTDLDLESGPCSGGYRVPFPAISGAIALSEGMTLPDDLRSLVPGTEPAFPYKTPRSTFPICSRISTRPLRFRRDMSKPLCFLAHKGSRRHSREVGALGPSQRLRPIPDKSPSSQRFLINNPPCASRSSPCPTLLRSLTPGEDKKIHPRRKTTADAPEIQRRPMRTLSPPRPLSLSGPARLQWSFRSTHLCPSLSPKCGP
jgi:hypothetical protein